MAKRNTSTERILTGQKDLDKRLNFLGTAGANRAARAGLLKGSRLAAKLIKRKIPAKYKGIRQAIGSSVKKTRAGITTAKAGAAVGKKVVKLKQVKRSSKGGVGIKASNVHWFILGTENRYRGLKGDKAERFEQARFIDRGKGAGLDYAATGKMKPFPAIKDAMSGGNAEVVAAIREGTLTALAKETAKLARKRKREARAR